MKLIDISAELMSAPVYPGDPKPWLEQIANQNNGQAYNLSAIHACTHTGTHIDTPFHYDTNGADAASLSLEAFIGHCRVISIPSGELNEVTAARLPGDCSRLLLCSNGKGWLSLKAAQILANKGILLIGTDSLSIGSGDSEADVHRLLLHHGIAILEGLSLSHVKTGAYFLIAPPLKIAGADGTPVRALLIDNPPAHSR